jgi:hypothetical protein
MILPTRTALLLSIVGGCARAPAVQRPAPSAAGPTVELIANSIPSEFGIQGRFVGVASLRDGWIDVTIISGAVRMQQRDPRLYNALRVRASVASCATRGQWRTAAEGSTVRIAPALRVTDDAITDVTEHPLADSIQLSVAVPRDVDFTQSWVALILEWPFENDFVSYSVHSAVSLAALSNARAPQWNGPRATTVSVRCR